MFKRALSFVLCLLMLLSLCGCGEKEQTESKKDDSAANVYLETAQMFVSKGDYESAIETLQEGIKKTNSDKFSSYLQSVKEMQANSGGSKDPSAGVSANPTQPSDPHTNRGSLPGIEEIREDLLMVGANNMWIAKDWRELNIESVEALRRRGDETEDEVHVTVVFGDEYYCVKEEYRLHYSYYTEGGWYLEDYDTVNSEITVRMNPRTNEDVISYMQMYFTTFNVDKREQTINSYGTFVDTIQFTATYEYEIYTIVFLGNYIMTFADGLWNVECYFDVSHFDWSKMIGTYKYEYKDQVGVTLVIEDVVQIDEKFVNITYSGYTIRYDSYYQDWEYETKDTVTSKEWLSFEDVTIFGKTFTIPNWIRGGLLLPWEDRTSLNILVNHEDGFFVEDLIYNGKYYLEKYVPES